LGRHDGTLLSSRRSTYRRWCSDAFGGFATVRKYSLARLCA
jgi:hypothetical protein